MEMVDINPFVKESSYYKREVDIVEGYVSATAMMLNAAHPQYEVDYCEDYVRNSMKEGEFNELKDPKVMFISQRSRGNRNKEVGTLLSTLREIVEDEDLIFTPSMIGYQRPEVVKSLLSEFIFGNVTLRKDYKNRMFEYGNAGDKVLSAFYNILQTAVKELNNSVSGAGLSQYNATFNQSSHLSLTAGCRTSTSYANASNERFIAGNRHYYKNTVVLQELSNAALYGPHNEIQGVINKYGIKIPTVEDTMECVLKSSRKYWYDNKNEGFILNYIKGMSDMARAAFVYTGDAFHLSKLNPGFVESLLGEFVDLGEEIDPSKFAPDNYLNVIDKDKQVTVSLLKSDLMVGTDFKQLSTNRCDKYDQVNAATYGFLKLLTDKSDLIDALWRPRYLQSAIGKFRSARREAVLTSDTDSTIMTTQYWTHKVTGSYNLLKRSYNVGYVVGYFASQIVANSLALMCGNMGISPSNLGMLQMKNEYYFPVYGLTNISKHYFALMSAREGNIMDEPELELKGVHLISSKTAVQFMIDFRDWVQHHVLTNIMNDAQLKWADYMEKPISQELEIRHDIRVGGIKFYSRENIKDPKDYKQGEDNSSYFQYLLWREVFAEKYGDVEAPPLSATKIPVDLSKPRKVMEWILSIQDKKLASRLENFLNKADKSSLTAILIPTEIVLTVGVPDEIRLVIDEYRATNQIMTPYYTILQALGIYVGNTKHTRLLTDNYIDEYMAKQELTEQAA